MKSKRVSGSMLTLFLIGAVTLTFWSVDFIDQSTTTIQHDKGNHISTNNDDKSTMSEPPLTEWNKTYGGTEFDRAYSVVQTGDGGYAIAGETRSYGAGGVDIWLVKTDAAGNKLWNQTYGGIGRESARSLVQTSDGGYALAGDNGLNFLLVKTDSAGNKLWDQAYPSARGYAYSLVQTSDGGFVLAGDNSTSGGYDFCLVKTSSNGTMLWSKTYRTAEINHAFSVVQTADGGYALAGLTGQKSGPIALWLVKTDSAGNMLWNKTYGGTIYEDVAHSVVQTVDGGYALAGYTSSYGVGVDFWLVKTDSSGNAQWNKTYGGAGGDSAYSVVQTADGGYVLAGFTNSFGAGSEDIWMVKVNSEGTAQWNKTYGGIDSDVSYSVVQTVDGGYALAGYTKSFGAGYYDCWLIKLAPELEPYVEGEAIVGFYGPMAFSQNISSTMVARYGITLKDTSTELSASLYTGVDDNTFAQLQVDSDVKYAERNYIRESSLIPNDPGWPQWGPLHIAAERAWDVVTGSSVFRVAVVDSGINYTHPDLSANYQAGGFDWVNNDNDPMDDNGHGTHVAGILGAVGNNGIGVTGMAWTIKIIAEKVMGANGRGNDWNIGRGIVDAVLREAKIINLSLGGWDDSDFLRQSVQFASNHRRLLVAASGNDWRDMIRYPARYNEVIAVGAIDFNNNLAYFNYTFSTNQDFGSNWGPEQELVAPGGGDLNGDLDSQDNNERILSTLQGAYGLGCGTSMAAPHVAGVAALAWILNPDLSSDELRQLLCNTADDLGTPGRDDTFGWGRVNASRIVRAAQFRHAIDVTPTSQTITPGGTETYTVSVSLIQGTPQTVSLSLDPMYPLNPDLAASWNTQSGTPPFTAILTLTASIDAIFFTENLRIRSTYNVAGFQMIHHSDFFSISITSTPGDFVWIKTSPNDDGNVPRTDRRLYLSPDIWSSPDPPELGQTNTLYLRVRNKGTVNTGQVLVQAWFTDWSPFSNILDLPSLGPATISNIPPGGSETVGLPWFLPSTFSPHICVYAQAWRPALEPFSNQFDLTNNNNIAQKNFDAVTAPSPFTTTLKIRNPTDQTISMELCVTPPDSQWTVDVCRASTFNGAAVKTPLTIPPNDFVELNLTIIRPEWADLGLVHLTAKVEDYEKLYPELSGFTFEVRRPNLVVHDIDIPITTPSKTVVARGYPVSFNVTIVNQGNFTEAFPVTVYANAIAIQTLNLTLAGGTSIIRTFAWNTTGYAEGNYTIKAYAWPVPGEIDTADNTCISGRVYVAKVGDITGPTPGVPDNKIDIRDVASVAVLFGVNIIDPKYNPNNDITGPTTGVPDGKIDMRDVALVCRHYGEIY